jgi:hypothetical protein
LLGFDDGPFMVGLDGNELLLDDLELLLLLPEKLGLLL